MAYAAIALPGVSVRHACAADWPQFGMDPAHTGFNAAERGYSTPGNLLAFAPVALPSPVDGAPIFAANVPAASGAKDLLLAVAVDGTLLALDAASGAIAWSRRPAGAGTLTSTAPALDPDRAHVYAYGLDGKVHKYNLASGDEVLVPAPDSAPCSSRKSFSLNSPPTTRPPVSALNEPKSKSPSVRL